MCRSGRKHQIPDLDCSRKATTHFVSVETAGNDKKQKRLVVKKSEVVGIEPVSLELFRSNPGYCSTTMVTVDVPSQSKPLLGLTFTSIGIIAFPQKISRPIFVAPKIT